ncbi:MAG: DUF695 domain-containing protein [Planctomycetes bacterium]|nr:DUF695 domain-containing protein [Planctomycetota bacterium]
MRPTFEYYMAKLDDWPFEVRVDLSLMESAPDAAMPIRWHIRLELNHPTVDGLCTAEEQALLLAIQEEIQAALTDDACQLVAVVTHRNARTMVVYSSEAPEEGHPVLKALSRVETHETRVIHEEDASWTEYRDFLYPNASLLHQIKDRRVLREFERNGDDCSEVHCIEPRFVGLNEDGAHDLAKSLAKAGFGVKAVDEIGANGEREWQVTAAAQSPLALSILDDFRQKWIDMAEQAGGRYDGWSAEVVPVTGSNNNHGVDGHLAGGEEDYDVHDSSARRA